MHDSKEDLEKSVEIKKKLFGETYLWKDIWYCLFNNKDTFPNSTGILCRIKCEKHNAGVIYVTNFERQTYREVYYDDISKLNAVYRASKKNILTRPNLAIGWEGVMLNNAKYS